MPRSQQIKTHPGSYNPLTSDFEKNRIDVLKKKRMLARSGWAQNISFESTEERFHQHEPGSSAPPPGTYHPKTSLVDHLPKQNPRGGAFGSNLKVEVLPSLYSGGLVSLTDRDSTLPQVQHSHQQSNQKILRMAFRPTLMREMLARSSNLNLSINRLPSQSNPRALLPIMRIALWGRRTSRMLLLLVPMTSLCHGRLLVC
jgi:hypothetical protein